MTEQVNKEIDIAIGFVVRKGKILLLQRKHSLPIWDKKWEFPGGKIEPNESPHEAFIREVQEETQLQVENVEFVGMHHHDWHLENATLTVHIHCFRGLAVGGPVVCETHSAYTHAWATPEEALTFDSLEANDDILRKFIQQI